MNRAILAWALMLGACGGDEANDDRIAAILELDGDVAAGATGYASNCASCHGADGEGGTGPAMADAVTLSDEDIVDVVLNGVGGMPGFDSLEDQEIADILAFVTDTF